MMLRSLAFVAALALFSGCSLIGIKSGYEQPAYTVVERIGERVEIRRYASRLAAETTVAASDAGQARNESFETSSTTFRVRTKAVPKSR